ncbi:MAG: hypothetical protein ACI9W4_002416 [Rhodothermales bacterium]|jgi:hypothetical protein
MNHPGWPRLPLAEWEDTYATVHLWTQIVGKIRLAHMPWVNHSWHVPLYVTARGLGTDLIASDQGSFSIDFDFVDHTLLIQTTAGDQATFALAPMSVAEFYERIMSALDSLGLRTAIWTTPVEIPGPVSAFPDDHDHASYDADAVQRFWTALVSIHRVFTRFRSGYLGKSSPVHFFWGAFDLAVSRFSGKTAPKHPGGAPHLNDEVMQEAYSHEVSSAGFWPGAGLGEAAFYAYAYPQPAGFEGEAVEPSAAYYYAQLGEYLLPYDAVASSDTPEADLMAFLETTYGAAARLAGWDRSALERQQP